MSLSDQDPETEVQKQPIFNLPWIVPALIGLMALIHFLRMSIFTQDQNYWVIIEFAFIPVRYVHTELLQLSAYAGLWSPITYSFLHADWAHLLMNSFWLLAFGGVTARRLGLTRFLILFGIGSVCGAGLHYIFHADDISPMIGASASVSACMGAAMRLPYLAERQYTGDIASARIRSLVEALTNRQAFTFMAVWFAVNLLFGTGIIDVTGSGNAIAWEAHIGGFLAGLLLFGLVDSIGRRSTAID